MLALLLAASLAFLVVSLRGGQPKRERGQEPGQIAERPAAAVKGRLQPAAGADVDFRRYALLASSSIFSETRAQPPAVKKPGRTVQATPNWPTGGTPQPPRPRGPDLSGWSYAGYVTLDGEDVGVIQNESTVSCQFLAVGDQFMGAEVTSLDREAIRFGAGGSSTTLSRPRDFSLGGGGGGRGGPGPQPQRPGAAAQRGQ